MKIARNVASFIFPLRYGKLRSEKISSSKKVIAVIPTYKPSSATQKLVLSLINLNSNVDVIVVDDSTPTSAKKPMQIIYRLRYLAKSNPRVTYLRTPANKLKSGALNWGLTYIRKQKLNPNVVVTFDDDVRIDQETIQKLVSALYSDKRIGAVCSLAHVDNKNANLLTRLQALEYHTFNVTKLADNGFVKGPLVMQGMLVAFRYRAMKKLKGFDETNLIEDYEITARIKKLGWDVRIVSEAKAWTEVPTTFQSLWRQRVRWSFGGLTVLSAHWKAVAAVLQDWIGHGLFLATLAMIILSFVYPRGESLNTGLIIALVVISLMQFFISYAFGVYVLMQYHQADRVDYLIRLSVIPEFLYGMVLTVILIGSYIFYLYNLIFQKILKRLPRLERAYALGLGGFKHIGYTYTWGTRV